MPRTVERVEDMSCRGKLKLLQQDDGDIIVAIYPEEDGIVMPGGSVEFCLPFTGGGRSPKTLEALRNLMKAMEEDNEERPIAV